MKDPKPPPNTASPQDKPATTPPPALRFDWRDWLPYLEDADIAEDQKRELIETLWAIVTTFVDMGFQLNPPRQSCGQEIDLTAALHTAMLRSEDTAKDDEEAA